MRRLVLAAASLLLAIAGADGALRLVEPEPANGFAFPYDASLGWAPRAGFADIVDGTRLSIDGEGLRSNGQPRPQGAPLLAVGDSLAFGWEVGDDESWPAVLERELGAPVLNGGVPGYGFDQAFLRAIQLCIRYRPRAVVVGLIPDDVLRCRLDHRLAPKPWFTVQGGHLFAHGVPVRQEERRGLVGLARKAGGANGNTVTSWAAVSEELTRRLPLLAPRVLLVLYCHPHAVADSPRFLEPVRRAARELRIELLDLVGETPVEMFAGDRSVAHHFNAQGNAFVAERVAAVLRRADG